MHVAAVVATFEQRVCYICGQIGHTTQKIEKKMIENESQNNIFQYGNWLRVPVGVTNQNNGLWRNGIEMIKGDKGETSLQYRNTSEVFELKALKIKRIRYLLRIRMMNQKQDAKWVSGEFRKEEWGSRVDVEGRNELKMGRNSNIRVTGYYGHANPSERNSSWDILKSVGAAVNEEWVVGSDFNAVLNDAEKDSGRRIVRAQMNDFRDILDDLALVDIKQDRGWFTWINNSEGDRLFKERLDRSITSVSMAEKFPFIAPSVIRQSQSDHDAILLDLYSRKPKGHPHDNKIRFRYEECWAVEEDVKSIINKAWEKDGSNYGN
ncbi:hypothetical protein PVK06_045429 [Gossypium arboreum]|uniref:Endonuclease/exonuclease/phosphatase domain-containing protein n=1 Tax=Gossypium arboreum TaxID=29729 RepID=A0ABR0MU17_GOSAR|nr:hypothetical protein PVK06_045429 [Gossypium arboreum]